MNSQHPTRPNLPSADSAGLQVRVAARLAGALSEHSAVLPHDIGERLRFAREQALARAQAVRRPLPVASAAGITTPVAVSAQGALMLGGSAPWWQRALAVVPLVLLVSGLVLIQQWSVREQMLAAADIDAVLLADDLPPAAYSDPGFAEFLRSAPP
ncbi:MAG: DUF3619 family protein [Chitinophagaceae bacterium]|nr:DUF3619 family protein [Rubrivivax sp.]